MHAKNNVKDSHDILNISDKMQARRALKISAQLSDDKSGDGWGVRFVITKCISQNDALEKKYCNVSGSS